MSKKINKPTILVVEDEPLLLNAISRKLNTLGVECVTATTVKQALDYLDNLPELPQAIWLDYYLKDGNGLDLVNQVKSKKDLNKIPIVVVSNSASEDKVKNMLALGIEKYILKADYRLEDIVKIIIDLVHNEK